MVVMDGSEVRLGDRVFDVVYGLGTVVELQPMTAQFRVEFGDRKKVMFDNQGLSKNFKTRTLFWHDPIIAIPLKPDTGWLKIKNICRAVVDTMRAGRDVP